VPAIIHCRSLNMRCTIALLLGFLLALPAAAAEVNIYSARNEALIKPLLDRYAALTNVRVNLVTGDADALIKRLEMEAANSPADLLLTVDVGRLHRAARAGLLQPVDSDVLRTHIPAQYRDPENLWFGLSTRARVIMYALDRVHPDQLSTYEALAEPRWKGRLCVRSSSSIYNQSLVASLIAHLGVEQTERWAKGLVGNLARPPVGGDRDQIAAVAAGQCDAAIANTYYLAGMQHSGVTADTSAAARVGVFWPNQDDRGTHVNISGAGVTRAARNRHEAVRLLEFMVGEEAQTWYAETNHEYPVRAGIEASETLRRWGEFKADALPLDRLGELNGDAVRLMDRARWR
jgi:iron(III) transport system substrate-binding protein